MTETATISGGKQVTLSLHSQFLSAKAALDQLSQGYSDSVVFSSTAGTPVAGKLNAYDIDGTQGGSYSLPNGGQTLIVYDKDNEPQASVTITGSSTATNQVLIGNDGDDTINTNGGSGSVTLGDGKNLVNVAGGVQNISAGTGQDTIKATGNDTITLGSGNDTLTATGSATVTGGTGSLRFQGGVDSQVTAGSGSETLFGGSGTSTFYGSSTGGSDYMVGGSGKNFFEGGNGSDTMVASGSSKFNQIFDFASSVHGGTHTIDGFTISGSSRSADIVQLQGYSMNDVKSVGLDGAGHSTVIKLDDGTSITLTGVTNFHEQDIKFTS